MDDRPLPDSEIPPVALLYEGFGEFQDYFERYGNLQSSVDVLHSEFEGAVDAFALAMSGFFQGETERQQKGLDDLNVIFSTLNEATPKLAASAIKSVRTDGHFLGDHDAAVVITEFEDWVENGIASTQLGAYFAHSLKVALESRRDNEVLFASWRVPCLGISTVGARIHDVLLLELTRNQGTISRFMRWFSSVVEFGSWPLHPPYHAFRVQETESTATSYMPRSVRHQS